MITGDLIASHISLALGQKTMSKANGSVVVCVDILVRRLIPITRHAAVYEHSRSRVPIKNVISDVEVSPAF